MLKLTITLAISVLWLIGLIQTPTTRALQELKIEGQVMNKSGDLLPGVLVRVYRGTKPVNEARTDGEGKYSVSYSPGEPITYVRYDLTNWDPCLVEAISGNRDHRINKILSPPNPKSSPNERKVALTTLETLRAIDMANGISEEKFNAEYKEVIAAVSDPASNRYVPKNEWVATLGAPSQSFINQQALLLYAQRQLKDLKYYNGALTGEANSEWMAAVRDYRFDVASEQYVKAHPLWGDSSTQPSLAQITSARASRLITGSIRVTIDAYASETAQQVYTYPFTYSNTLYVYVLGQNAATPITPGKRTLVLSEVYDNLANVKKVVIQGVNKSEVIDLTLKAK